MPLILSALIASNKKFRLRNSTSVSTVFLKCWVFNSFSVYLCKIQETCPWFLIFIKVVNSLMKRWKWCFPDCESPQTKDPSVLNRGPWMPSLPAVVFLLSRYKKLTQPGNSAGFISHLHLINRQQKMFGKAKPIQKWLDKSSIYHILSATRLYLQFNPLICNMIFSLLPLFLRCLLLWF